MIALSILITILSILIIGTIIIVIMMAKLEKKSKNSPTVNDTMVFVLDLKSDPKYIRLGMIVERLTDTDLIVHIPSTNRTVKVRFDKDLNNYIEIETNE